MGIILIILMGMIFAVTIVAPFLDDEEIDYRKFYDFLLDLSGNWKTGIKWIFILLSMGIMPWFKFNNLSPVKQKKLCDYLEKNGKKRAVKNLQRTAGIEPNSDTI